MAGSVWVAVLHVSGRTAEKLANVHGLSEDEVRLHVQCVSGLRGAWHEHPDRGLRMLLKVPMRGGTVLVVLYPRDGYEDEWNLASAYHI